MKRKQAASFGTISHGSMLESDLIPAFADELRRLRGALPRNLHNRIRAWEAAANRLGMEDSDMGDLGDAAELVNDLADALNEYAPEYGYFGSHPGDGSDYGFWLHEDFMEMMRDDGVLIVDDLSEVADDYRGAIAVVNDHGNVTLYRTKPGVGTLEEVWGVV
jgi:hypothetical protein